MKALERVNVVCPMDRPSRRTDVETAALVHSNEDRGQGPLFRIALRAGCRLAPFESPVKEACFVM